MKNFNKSIFVLLLVLMILPTITNAQSNKNTLKQALEKLKLVENRHKAVPRNLLTSEERAALRDYHMANSTQNTPDMLANGDVYVMDVYNLVYGNFSISGPYVINETGFGSDIFADDYDSSGTLYGLNAETNSLVIMDTSNGCSPMSAL